MSRTGSGKSHDERFAAIGSGLPLAYKRAEDCPDAAKHTKSPDGYIQWHAWAERKAKTHTPHQCPTCGFWTIWKPKRKRKAASMIEKMSIYGFAAALVLFAATDAFLLWRWLA